MAWANNIGTAGIIPYRAALVRAGGRKGYKAGVALADNNNPIGYHRTAYGIQRSIGRISKIERKIYIAGAGIAGLLTAFYYSYGQCCQATYGKGILQKVSPFHFRVQLFSVNNL